LTEDFAEGPPINLRECHGGTVVFSNDIAVDTRLSTIPLCKGDRVCVLLEDNSHQILKIGRVDQSDTCTKVSFLKVPRLPPNGEQSLLVLKIPPLGAYAKDRRNNGCFAKKLRENSCEDHRIDWDITSLHAILRWERARLFSDDETEKEVEEGIAKSIKDFRNSLFHSGTQNNFESGTLAAAKTACISFCETFLSQVEAKEFIDEIEEIDRKIEQKLSVNKLSDFLVERGVEKVFLDLQVKRTRKLPPFYGFPQPSSVEVRGESATSLPVISVLRGAGSSTGKINNSAIFALNVGKVPISRKTTQKGRGPLAVVQDRIQILSDRPTGETCALLARQEDKSVDRRSFGVQKSTEFKVYENGSFTAVTQTQSTNVSTDGIRSTTVERTENDFNYSDLRYELYKKRRHHIKSKRQEYHYQPGERRTTQQTLHVKEKVTIICKEDGSALAERSIQVDSQTTRCEEDLWREITERHKHDFTTSEVENSSMQKTYGRFSEDREGDVAARENGEFTIESQSFSSRDGIYEDQVTNGFSYARIEEQTSHEATLKVEVLQRTDGRALEVVRKENVEIEGIVGEASLITGQKVTSILKQMDHTADSKGFVKTTSVEHIGAFEISQLQEESHESFDGQWKWGEDQHVEVQQTQVTIDRADVTFISKVANVTETFDSQAAMEAASALEQSPTDCATIEGEVNFDVQNRYEDTFIITEAKDGRSFKVNSLPDYCGSFIDRHRYLIEDKHTEEIPFSKPDASCPFDQGREDRVLKGGQPGGMF